MGRLIAFDQQTASALVAKTRTAAQLGHGSPLKAALSNEGESTLLMRGREEDELLVVNVRRPPARPVLKATSQARPMPPPSIARPQARVTAPPASARPEPKPAPVIAEPATPTSKAAAQINAKPAAARVVSSPPPASQQSAAKPQAPAKPRQDMEPVAYEATGFLGLEDAPLYAEDLEPKPPKKWWQKLLD